MGTWGMKTFENDEALDWASELEGTKDVTLLGSSLHPAEVNDYYLEAPDCVRILCASEVIAGVIGKPRPSLPENISSWIAKNKNLKVKDLVPLAIEKVQRVLAKDSELDELWAENEQDYPIWKKDVEELCILLKSLPPQPEIPLKPWWKIW
jgi:hypothetical protein